MALPEVVLAVAGAVLPGKLEVPDDDGWDGPGRPGRLGNEVQQRPGPFGPAADGHEHKIIDAIDTLADQFGISEIERESMLPSGMASETSVDSPTPGLAGGISGQGKKVISVPG